MPKSHCYLLTKFRLFSLTRHSPKGKDLGVCAVCHKPLRVSDFIVRDGDSVLHSTCWPLFRVDSPDEPELESQIEIVENPFMKSQKDIEREKKKLLKLKKVSRY